MSKGTLRGLRSRTRQDHQILIQQNQNYVTLLLYDKQASGMVASGRWKHTDDPKQNSPEQLISFTTGSKLEHYWEWRGETEGIFQLRLGLKGTSHSSHRDGHERWFDVLITLRGIGKSMITGKFFSVNSNGRSGGELANSGIGDDGQRYFLGYKHDSKGGAINWDVVRYLSP
jgi:hypothetical protein